MIRRTLATIKGFEPAKCVSVAGGWVDAERDPPGHSVVREVDGGVCCTARECGKCELVKEHADCARLGVEEHADCT